MGKKHMIVNDKNLQKKPNIIQSVLRYIRRRLAAFQKPLDTEFILEYRKFKNNPEKYVLHGEEYSVNFRKSLGMARHSRAGFLGSLILKYDKNIEGLRVLNNKIYFEGTVIFDASKNFCFDSDIMERFLDFCFFYLYTKVDIQEEKEKFIQEEKFMRKLQKRWLERSNSSEKTKKY